jgi:formiminotetrahydrofolate cyclodeaminase
MGEMSGNFTAGRRKFSDVEEEVRGLLAGLAACREKLLALVDEDAEAYGAVDAAYAMPRGTEQEKSARAAAVDAALCGAMQAPLEVMRQCARVAAAAERLAEIGNRNLITDVGVSAVLAEAACAAARLNVEINLKFLRDDAASRTAAEEMDELTRHTRTSREAVSEAVAAYMRG